ncbi:hypothetical protein BJF83_14225 [Nocardiopsis sp. CNR-923]|nr:hypothetical protein BJF83_14225 [Nocardiopsis sp. CNR-923]
MIGGEDAAEVDAEQPLVDRDERQRLERFQHGEHHREVEHEVGAEQDALQEAMPGAGPEQRAHTAHVQVEALQREERVEEERLPPAEEGGQPPGRSRLVL